MATIWFGIKLGFGLMLAYGLLMGTWGLLRGAVLGDEALASFKNLYYAEEGLDECYERCQPFRFDEDVSVDDEDDAQERLRVP